MIRGLVLLSALFSVHAWSSTHYACRVLMIDIRQATPGSTQGSIRHETKLLVKIPTPQDPQIATRYESFKETDLPVRLNVSYASVWKNGQLQKELHSFQASFLESKTGHLQGHFSAITPSAPPNFTLSGFDQRMYVNVACVEAETAASGR